MIISDFLAGLLLWAVPEETGGNWGWNGSGKEPREF